MPSRRFDLFNDLLEDSDAGFPQSQIWKLPSTRVSWISGKRHVKPIPTPVEVQLNPLFGTYQEATYVTPSALTGQ